MSKETFYFSHDYNSRSDGKIKKLMSVHGWMGYGIFWALIEDLYQNANALPLHYQSIAYALQAHPDIVKSIIQDFDLFITDGDLFSSLSVQRRMEKRNEKSVKARESAEKRWKSSERNANALQTQSDINAIKESKVKDIKVKESIFKTPEEARRALEENFKDLVVSVGWLETIAMTQKISMPQVLMAIEDFKGGCLVREEYKTTKELKDHFSYWLPKNKDRLFNQKPKTQEYSFKPKRI